MTLFGLFGFHKREVALFMQNSLYATTIIMLLCDCVCLSLSYSNTQTHTHTEHEGADDLVWSRLDSPLLPPLPERGLAAGDQDDSLSWKRFPVLSHLLYIHMYVPHSGECVMCGFGQSLVC